MKPFYAVVSLMLSGYASATSSSTQCYTDYGRTSKRSIPTSSRTSTQTRTVTATCTSNPTTTVTPPATTTTSTSTVVATTTTTLPQSTDTITTSIVVLMTSTNTVTATVTTATPGPDVTINSGVVTTTPIGFLPVQSTLPQASYVGPNGKRAAPRGRRMSPDPRQILKRDQKGYPQDVVCVKYVYTYSTTTTTVRGSKTQTVTGRKPTSTSIVKTTSTMTQTTAPGKASTTVTNTGTITIITVSTTTATTTTQGPGATVVVPTAFVDVRCAAGGPNFANAAGGQGIIAGYDPDSQSGYSAFFITGQATLGDCCADCAANEDCGAFFWDTSINQCYMPFVSGTCVQGRDSEQAQVGGAPGSDAIIGNGNCGAYRQIVTGPPPS